MLMYSIVSLVSSIPICGFYFVVKAAMFYLHTNGQLEGNVIEVAEEKWCLGSTVVSNGAASYAVSESLVSAKVGRDSIKIVMKYG